MSEKQYKYKGFISYSHSDRKWAEWLLKSLENFKVPKNLVGRKTEAGVIPARLAPIFRDRDELPAAHRLTDRLFEALRASEYLMSGSIIMTIFAVLAACGPVHTGEP